MANFQSIGKIAGIRASDKGFAGQVHTALILREAERLISRALQHKLPFRVISFKSSKLTIGVLHPSIAERIRRVEADALRELRAAYPDEDIMHFYYKIIADYEIT